MKIDSSLLALILTIIAGIVVYFVFHKDLEDLIKKEK